MPSPTLAAGGRGGRSSVLAPSPDSLEERGVRRLLNARKGVRVERQFIDEAGGKHQVRSAPVRGGRYLYDSSRSWGLRALGFCEQIDGQRQVDALADDYVERCSRERRAVSRRLERIDIMRSGELG
jgi:hypothetical protein